ncbi:cortex morphogenetic protein CmpA [Thermoactinomyces mirandus]|uniref:Cortex morphogenetic protein CmpA n=1 Tax=Thermoactinomyces mirandus TaxID=2756294 RepID=A0A7W1XT31_9BACL|nr:cortex morphogenetic protein CmpA [Thermoactinomyces mirandus]MBA4602627.1 cortex morphogenetic protein CmpA [Thermoactinomyces mirandus]
MPRWLIKQMMCAFHKKDRRQIIFLNQCWFAYLNKRKTAFLRTPDRTHFS